MANVVFNAAYQSHLPRLVGRDRLVRANATLAATVSLTEIAGFAVAGWLVQWLGPPDALAVDAASFAEAVALVPHIDGATFITAVRRLEDVPALVDGEWTKHLKIVIYPGSDRTAPLES